MRNKLFLVVVSALILQTIKAQVYKNSEPFAHTYSIVAKDSATGNMAVAVQSHWFSVGTVVAWGQSGVGVVATQSFVNKSFGIRGLALLKNGLTAQQALDSLLATDEAKEVRQVAIIDTMGNIANFSGSKCIDFAGQLKGKTYSVQSNMMLTNKVNQAMATAYENNAKLPFAERILKSLDAAQKVGGDIRGMQSAAIIVVAAKPNNTPWDDKIIDLRVDDSEKPLEELNRLYKVHLAYEHMNKGDLYIEKNDMPNAMKEYKAAQQLFPKNEEMQYWQAITLANNKDIVGAKAILKKVYAKNKNWLELTKRLPKVGLLSVDEKGLKELLGM
jgi:uncharacterized Ntn-hydrolase superfamily protein